MLPVCRYVRSQRRLRFRSAQNTCQASHTPALGACELSARLKTASSMQRTVCSEGAVGGQEGQEVAYVAQAHAVVDPRAVVVKARHTPAHDRHIAAELRSAMPQLLHTCHKCGSAWPALAAPSGRRCTRPLAHRRREPGGLAGRLLICSRGRRRRQLCRCSARARLWRCLSTCAQTAAPACVCKCKQPPAGPVLMPAGYIWQKWQQGEDVPCVHVVRSHHASSIQQLEASGWAVQPGPPHATSIDWPSLVFVACALEVATSTAVMRAALLLAHETLVQCDQPCLKRGSPCLPVTQLYTRPAHPG